MCALIAGVAWSRGIFGHHLIKGCPHGLDEFWTVARHDTVSRLCAGRVAGLALTGQTQSREWNHANVTFDVLSISQTQRPRKNVILESPATRLRNLFVNTHKPGEG